MKQLWGRAPLSDTAYLPENNPLKSSESHPMTRPVFGTKSPKFLIFQEGNGLRSAGRTATHTGLCGRGKTAGVGGRCTCCSIFEHGDRFMGLAHCCSAVLLNTGLYCSLASSLEDHRAGDRAGDRLPTPETRVYLWRVISIESYGLFEKSAASRLILKICHCNCGPAICVPSPSPTGV